MSNGCRASIRSRRRSLAISGATARMSRARRAMAWTASSSPMVSAAVREVVGPIAHAHGQRLEDQHDLAPLLVLQLDDVVVELDRGQRLDEDARPGARAAVHDARDLAAVLGLQQHHVAVVARGDELVLQHAVGVLAVEERLHHRGELRPQAGERAPRLGQLGRGVVRDLAAGKDGAADRHRHLRRVAHERGAVGEAGRAFVARHAAGDLDGAFDERRHVGKRERLEVQALDAGRGKDRGDVGKVVVGLAAERLENPNALGGEAQRLTDRGDLGQGRRGFDAPPAARRARVLKQQGPDLVELERPKRHSVHVAMPALCSIGLVPAPPRRATTSGRGSRAPYRRSRCTQGG